MFVVGKVSRGERVIREAVKVCIRKERVLGNEVVLAKIME